MDRIQMIKAAQEKINRRKALVEKIKASNHNALGHASRIAKTEDEKLVKEIDRLDENYNHWTDAPKYAKEFYGEVYHETTKFDNEWN